MKTAVNHIPWHNMRQLRADALASHVMRIVEPFIRDRDHDTRKPVYEALFKAFHEAGVEVITDADRARAGLMPRNDQGYTHEDLQIMECQRREAMLRVVPGIFTIARRE